MKNPPCCRRWFMLLCILLISVLCYSAAYAGTQIDETNFPDAIFRKYVSDEFDADEDGWLIPDEIEAVTSIQCYYSDISSLKGIEHFTSATELLCFGNKLTELDLSQNTALTSLNCFNNELTSLDVSMLPNLTSLICSYNKLSELDISHCPVILDMVKKRKPAPESGVLYWAIDESFHGRNYHYSALNIDQNVKLYTGDEAGQ